MGRYFLYRMHPFSVAECLRTETPSAVISPPARISEADWNALRLHGGFPEPFLARSSAFTRKWARLRLDQLTGEDLRDLGAFRDLAGLDQLARILSERSSVQLNFAELARDLQVTAETSNRWVAALEQLHLGFTLRPWFKDIANSLRKEPRWFLRDWSGVEDVSTSWSCATGSPGVSSRSRMPRPIFRHPSPSFSNEPGLPMPSRWNWMRRMNRSIASRTVGVRCAFRLEPS
ncbi:MAG: hypothetical protein LW626_12345 [Verrucomicrobium sp.]|nr:hypothetical protein [Verrucomicrobium sp.]